MMSLPKDGCRQHRVGRRTFEEGRPAFRGGKLRMVANTLLSNGPRLWKVSSVASTPVDICPVPNYRESAPFDASLIEGRLQRGTLCYRTSKAPASRSELRLSFAD